MSAENTTPSWSNREAYLLALVCLLVGAAIGYLARGGPSPAPMPAAPATPAVETNPGQNPLHSAESVHPLAEALLTSLKTDPKNAETLIKLGNLYYDHHVFPEAIEYFHRALEIRPNDVNARTDLGTSYWYAGFPEKAVAQYEQSLAVEPNHAQSLFNLGVVYLEGLKDPRRAIAAWEKLLKAHPEYPEKDRALRLIEEAKARLR